MNSKVRQCPCGREICINRLDCEKHGCAELRQAKREETNK